jgi:hypothetical protein
MAVIASGARARVNPYIPRREIIPALNDVAFFIPFS